MLLRRRPGEYRILYRWEYTINTDIKEIGVYVRSYMIRLMIGITGDPLWLWRWTYRFHKKETEISHNQGTKLSHYFAAELIKSNDTGE